MIYRLGVTFMVENGHILSKHAGNCHFPHGHSRKIEVIVAANALDKNDMVCDFEALETLVWSYIQQFDHAICVNTDEKLAPALKELYPQRLVLYDQTDPTTEVMAAQIFRHIQSQLAATREIKNPRTGLTFMLPATVKLDRVRVWETVTNWAEVTD